MDRPSVAEREIRASNTRLGTVMEMRRGRRWAAQMASSEGMSAVIGVPGRPDTHKLTDTRIGV